MLKLHKMLNNCYILLYYMFIMYIFSTINHELSLLILPLCFRENLILRVYIIIKQVSCLTWRHISLICKYKVKKTNSKYIKYITWLSINCFSLKIHKHFYEYIISTPSSKLSSTSSLNFSGKKTSFS